MVKAIHESVSTSSTLFLLLSSLQGVEWCLEMFKISLLLVLVVCRLVDVIYGNTKSDSILFFWTGNWGCGELGPQHWDGHEDYRISSGICAQGSTSVCLLINLLVGCLRLKLNTLERNPQDSCWLRREQQWLFLSACPAEWANADGCFAQRSVESHCKHLHHCLHSCESNNVYQC